MAKQNIKELVQMGEDLIARARYDRAHELYNKALEIEPGHYLIRNALAELMFIKKEYIAAADNFYLAAFDESNRIDLGLLLSDSSTKLELIMKKNDEAKKAMHLLQDYAEKSGMSLFAHKYDEPTEVNPRQAKIDRFRMEFDPCGYSGCTNLDPRLQVRLDQEVRKIGKQFMMIMNVKALEQSQKTPPLQIIMDLLHF